MNRAGTYKTNLSGELAFRSFCPSPLPPDPALESDAVMSNLLVEAKSAVAKLDAISSRLPSVPLFVSMYVRKEALLSSQIEGTQAMLDDILNPDIEENTNQNVSDVVNYIKATDFALERLNVLPLCNRLLLETHAVLLNGLRGSDKNSGEFRRSQNWIGPGGSTLKTARYIPPSPGDMDIAMTDLEKYMNDDDQTDPLVRIALIHYQLETIHPFLDGNGRIGRLMVNLYLKEHHLLTVPTLYISYFLKRNRAEYYDRLNLVREKGDFEQWVKFFLQGIYESAVDSIESIDLLTALHDKNSALIISTGSSSKSLLKLFALLEKTPIVDVKRTAATMGSSFNTAAGAFKKLEQLGILRQTGSQKRNRRFAYEDYLKILRKDT